MEDAISPQLPYDPVLSDQNLLEFRLSAIQECIKRSRLALFLCILSSLASLICVWNTALSVDRLSYFRLSRIGTYEECKDENFSKPCTPEKAPDLNKKLVESLADKWMESTYITVPAIGVKVSVLDFSAFNSFAMLFFSIYLLLSARRENREIGSLLNDLVRRMYLGSQTDQRYDHMCLSTVYRSICAYIVFIVPSHPDKPIDSFVNSLNRRSLPLAEWLAHDATGPKIRGLRGAIEMICYLPAATMVVNFVFHAALIFQADYILRDKTKLLPLMIVVEAWELFCLVYVIYLTTRIRAFSKATRRVIFDELRPLIHLTSTMPLSTAVVELDSYLKKVLKKVKKERRRQSH